MKCSTLILFICFFQQVTGQKAHLIGEIKIFSLYSYPVERIEHSNEFAYLIQDTYRDTFRIIQSGENRNDLSVKFYQRLLNWHKDSLNIVSYERGNYLLEFTFGNLEQKISHIAYYPITQVKSKSLDIVQKSARQYTVDFLLQATFILRDRVTKKEILHLQNDKPYQLKIEAVNESAISKSREAVREKLLRDKLISDFVKRSLHEVNLLYFVIPINQDITWYSDENSQGGYEDIVKANLLVDQAIVKMNDQLTQGIIRNFWSDEVQSDFSKAALIYRKWLKKGEIDVLEGIVVPNKWIAYMHVNYINILIFTKKFDLAEKQLEVIKNLPYESEEFQHEIDLVKKRLQNIKLQYTLFQEYLSSKIVK